MLENVLTALGDNSNAVAELKTFIETNQTNVDRIGTLETNLNDAVDRRKELHARVSKATGLTDLTEDALNSFAKNADEGLKADNETLQANLLKLQGDYDGLGSTHESEISEMILKDTLRGLGVADMVQNDRAFKELTKLVLDGAVREGSVFTFKDGDKTIFNGGRPVNIEDRLQTLREGDFSYLFKPSKGGGGGQGEAPTTSHTSANNDNDRAASMAKRMGHRA